MTPPAPIPPCLGCFKELSDKFLEIFSELDGREWEVIYDEYVDTAKARCKISGFLRTSCLWTNAGSEI
jgi:hypothetical protein